MIVIGNVLPEWQQAGLNDEQIKAMVASSFTVPIPFGATGFITGVEVGDVGEQLSFPVAPNQGNGK
jgi:hypothetical protein